MMEDVPMAKKKQAKKGTQKKAAKKKAKPKAAKKPGATNGNGAKPEKPDADLDALRKPVAKAMAALAAAEADAENTRRRAKGEADAIFAKYFPDGLNITRFPGVKHLVEPLLSAEDIFQSVA